MKQRRSSRKPREWPIKAYRDLEFLNSADARPIRVLCEFTEPRTRFRKMRVRNTIAFFGSARAHPHEIAQRDLEAARATAGSSPSREHQERLDMAERAVALSRYYDDAMELARRLTEWSLAIPKHSKRFHICSGGGPGIMEAANRGASLAGGQSIGLNISLPFEQVPNPYQTHELSFEFHYFFVRKFWFVYLAKAMVVFPGGYGSFDELFELLTLIQTGKSGKQMPIVIFGTDYWHDVLDFGAMARWGVISQDDLDLFRFCDDVGDAFDYLTNDLTARYLDGNGG